MLMEISMLTRKNYYLLSITHLLEDNHDQI